MIRRAFTAILGFGVLASSAWSVGRPLSYADAVTLALQNNLSSKLAKADTEEARARVTEAAAALLPNLVGSVSQARTFKTNLAANGFPTGGNLPFDVLIGPYNTFDARFLLTQRIFDLQLYRRAHSARSLANVADWQSRLAGDQVTSAAALAYIEAQRSTRVVEAAQSDVDLANTLFNQTQDQHRAGTATGVDIARAQTRLVQEQVRLIRANVDARRAAIRLARVTGLPLAEPLMLTDSLPAVQTATAPFTADLVPAAWDHRLEIRVARAIQTADNDELHAAQAAFVPTIRAAADYGFSGNLPEGSARTGSIRGQLDLPIFSGGALTAGVKNARARKEASDAQMTDIGARVEEDVRLSLDSLNASVDELTATNLEVELAQRELQLARDRFAAGVGDNIQLLSAQTALETAREGQVNALAGYHVARVNWALAAGTVSGFHL
jgi:outer membrane protein